MAEILFRQRGGGQLGELLPFYVKTANGATWPFCRLVMTEADITFSFIRQQRTLRYTDLSAIRISRWGYIQFITNEPSLNFAFSSFGLIKITSILKSKNIAIDPKELKKLKTAVLTVVAQVIFAVVVLAFVVSRII